MTWGDYFIALLVLVEAGASLTYLLVDGDWKQGIVWGGVAVSNAAYLAMQRT